jgi:hypothetical protein
LILDTWIRQVFLMGNSINAMEPISKPRVRVYSLPKVAIS